MIDLEISALAGSLAQEISKSFLEVVVPAIAAAGKTTPQTLYDNKGFFSVRETKYTLTLNTSTAIASADVGRVALILCPPTTQTTWHSTVNPAANGNGIPVISTGQPVILWYSQVGSLVQAAWWAFNTATGSETIMEIFFRPY